MGGWGAQGAPRHLQKATGQLGACSWGRSCGDPPGGQPGFIAHALVCTAHTCTCIHRHISYIHVYTQLPYVCTQSYVHAHTHKYMYIPYKGAYILLYTHVHIHTQAHVCTPIHKSHMYTHTHTLHTHPYTQTPIRYYIIDFLMESKEV